MDTIPLKIQIPRTVDQERFAQSCTQSGSDKNCLNHTFAGYHYMDHYAALLSSNPSFKPDADLRILELGVLGGNSLRLWRMLFPNSHVVGVDSTPDIRSNVGEVDGKTHVYVGNQTDQDLLLKLDQMHGPFDLVIDDGSHAYEDMLVSAITLLPRLQFGGMYFIEDINVSWAMPEWPGMRWSKYEPNDPNMMFDFLNKLMVGINMRSGPVLSIHYYHGLVAFQRANTVWHP